MLPKKTYYLNDYFDLFNIPINKEKEYMKTDIYELNNTYIIETDLPGIKKENIHINYTTGYLTISIKRENEKKENKNYIRRERFHGEIKRSFYIGIKKESDIKANYKEGLLQIIFPKDNIPENNNPINIK